MTVAMADEPDDAHAVDESIWERRMQAVSLRNAGMTYAQIAAAQGLSAAMVRRDVETALRELASGQLEQVIAKHRSVLMDIQRANYPAMLNGRDPKAQVAATKAILDALGHEAKLLGLYAPTRLVTGVGEVEFSERFVELISKVSPDTLKELLRGANVRPEPDRSTEPVDAEVVQLPGTDAALAAPPDGQAPGGPQREVDGGREPATPARVEAEDDGAQDDDTDDGWSNIGA